MKKYPNLLNADQLINDVKNVSCTLPNGRIVAARALPFYGDFRRFKAAWAVFTGRADALFWTGQ